MNLTIGVDARTFYLPESMARGIGHYSLYHLRAVVSALPDARFIFYSAVIQPNSSLQPLLGCPNVTVRSIDDYDESEVDLLHICDSMSEFPMEDSFVRMLQHPRVTVTFYDLIPLYVYFDLWPPEKQRNYTSRLQQLKDSTCHFLTISDYTRKDLVEKLHIPASRAIAIMAGFNQAIHKETSGGDCFARQVREKFGISKPFFLHVGAHDPHKNFNGAYQAFAKCQLVADVQMVVVGAMSAKLKSNALYAAERGLKDVIFTGFVTREELEALYHEAVGLLFLSRFEGFGFPVLEAMANGCPVITTNVTSIPEVAGDAAFMFAPDDIDSVAIAMQTLQNDPLMRSRIIEAGYRQAAHFAWEKTAEKTITVWRTMLHNRPSKTEKKHINPHEKTVSVMLDISVLGLAHHDQTSRTGVFRVVEQIARGLAASPDIELHFCSTQHVSEHAPHTMQACREYLAMQSEFKNVPFHVENYPQTDIFHSPFHPLPPQTDSAVRFQTMYDLIPILQPEFFQGRYNPLPKVIAGIMQSDHAICISESTREDLCRVTGINRNQTHVSHLAANHNIFKPCTDDRKLRGIRQKYNIGNAPYILSLCTLEPRKNIDHVIRAFATLVRSGQAGDTRLVLVGTKGWDFARIFSEIDSNPELHSRIVLTGYVPDEELAPLYSCAALFIYMSLYEGFGLPPLEAMQCGTPVITSNTSSLPEVVGDAGIMLDPHDLDGLRLAMYRVISDPELRSVMARLAVEQASKFSWDRCVAETIGAYKTALNSLVSTVSSTQTPNKQRKPLKLFFYRPDIDFNLDEAVCDLVPLVLDTKEETTCVRGLHLEKRHFHPITYEWRNNPIWNGYYYDPELYIITESPVEADYFIFPYTLDLMIECTGVDSVATWLRRLPYYQEASTRHVFMTFNDDSEPFGIAGVFFRASAKRSSKNPATFAIPYPVEDFGNHVHFEPDKIKYDISFVGFIGDSSSGLLRGKAVASLHKTSLLYTYISATIQFHGFEEPRVRQERRELFINSLAASWLVLCPRGDGENSYRFFEALSMGRIPVLISDDCALPFEDRIAYDSIVLRIPERDADHTADIVHRWLSNQTVESILWRCRSARKTWEQYFACPQWNRRIIEALSLRAPRSTVVIDGVIFQLQHGRPFGISRLWQSLLTEIAATPLEQNIVLLDRDGTAPEIPGIRKRPIPSFQLGSACSEAVMLDQLCCEEGASLFISTYYTFTNSTRSSLMLYDMIPERFQTVGPDAPNPEWRDKYHAIINSSSFTAISNSTANDLALFYPQTAQRPLSFVPCAVSDDFRTHSPEEIAAFKVACGIDRPYFILVGRRDPHKNAALFFNGFSQLPDRESYAILMAGGGTVLEPELRELAGPAAGYSAFLSDQDLSLAYSGAIALVYPSLYEGFGLPILEAMQSGCPVITCQNSSLPEVAGSAALYVGEHDAAGMAKALLDVQQYDVRSYLIKRGLERARCFSWKTSAELLSKIIQGGSSE